jgi:hypothetical protein
MWMFFVQENMMSETVDNSERVIAVPNAPEHPSSELKTLFSKFLLTLLSSWIVGPAGVLFLHFWGWGNNPVLISLLLALSAGAPVQLLLNEFVAPGATAGNFLPNRIQIGTVLAVTFVAIWLALLSSDEVHDGGPFSLAYPILAMLTALSIWLSYRISLHYYSAVLARKVGHRAAICVGIIPGATTLAVFALVALVGNPNLLVIAGILPAIFQFIVLRQMAPEPPLGAPTDYQPQGLRYAILFGMALLLIGVGVGSTVVRDSIASTQQSYAALILVSLNLIGTLVISLSRATYLSTGNSFGKMSGRMAFGLAIAAALSLLFSELSSAFFFLFALQFFVVVILAIGRNYVQKSTLQAMTR